MERGREFEQERNKKKTRPLSYLSEWIKNHGAANQLESELIMNVWLSRLEG